MIAKLTTAPRLLRVTDVLDMTVMSCLFIYAQMAMRTFHKQIHLGPRTIVWNEREVDQWIEDRMASR